MPVNCRNMSITAAAMSADSSSPAGCVRDGSRGLRVLVMPSIALLGMKCRSVACYLHLVSECKHAPHGRRMQVWLAVLWITPDGPRRPPSPLRLPQRWMQVAQPEPAFTVHHQPAQQHGRDGEAGQHADIPPEVVGRTTG